MSRQAHPAARKLSTSEAETAPDLRVLHPEQNRPSSSPEINLELVALEQELAQLRSENAELRTRVEQNELDLQAAIASEEAWLERQKENELLLEEKSDVIRGMHQKIQEMQQGSAGDNYAKAQELKRREAELGEMQRQLNEDKEALLTQMSAMEMELSRDRADIARQRNELTRLQSELQREIETASRDPLLYERLASLRRRHQEVAIGKGTPAGESPSTATAAPAQQPAAKRPSGLLRRLFGE